MKIWKTFEPLAHCRYSSKKHFYVSSRFTGQECLMGQSFNTGASPFPVQRLSAPRHSTALNWDLPSKVYTRLTVPIVC